ncbi:MAG TPA: efflux RND transporter periplasmic adaptor subunit, partial [Anaeromyxobacteraceae bacterium]|nr:efflux RND transporter periplasmic adaptor subunit [Anaeromyxobacteraceae bacterium]
AARPGRYTCPMHPEVVSDAEGRCPTCGMKLVRAEPPAAPAPAVAIAPDKQRVLGIAVAPVLQTSGARALRVLGRVAADEAHTYKVNAGISGSIHDVAAVATGSRVRKDQYLGSFYAPDAISVLQLFILNTQGFARKSAWATNPDGTPRGEGKNEVEVDLSGHAKSQSSLQNANIQQRVMQLENMGISARQRTEIANAGQLPDTIRIYAPADGFVLARAVFPGLKFDRGFEFYRIADLHKVWVLADVFPQDAQHVRAGMAARVSVPEQHVTLPAKVVEILPQFDAATRTLKVKLAVDNPALLLRPDMFVDVAVRVDLAPALVVPADAVVDSGLAKRVFVQTADGSFEARAVETGWRSGDQVEIVKGLREGERVVTSGTFFLDSETRMRSPVSGAAAAGPASVPSGASPRGGAGDVRHAHASAAGEEGMHRHGGEAR